MPLAPSKPVSDAVTSSFVEYQRRCESKYRAEVAERLLAENPERAQKLRNEDLGGKQYNIVTHSVVRSAPPTVDERPTSKFTHMSQQSCERGRNTQGMILPSHRMTSPFLDP